ATRTRVKTEAGRRTVAMVEPLADLLHQHRLTQVERGVPVRETDFVFSTASGRPTDRRRVHRAVQNAAKKAGLISGKERLRPHDLRSAFALQSLKTGPDLPTLQRLLGHSTAAMSLSYARLLSSDEALPVSAYAEQPKADVAELRRAS